jgi:pimeloyl-ACP methyl ester carboxylesterase
MKLARSTVGTGRPLIVAHGLLGQGRNWRALQRALAARLVGTAVTAVDLRNHGHSPHAPSMTLEDMAGDIEGLLDELGWRDPADCLGHSMGGKVMMHLALTRPRRVRRLVVADVAPVKYPTEALGGHAQLIDAMMQLPLEQVGVRRSFVFSLFSSLSLQVSSVEDARLLLAPAVADVAVREFLLTNLASSSSSSSGRLRWLPPLATLRASLGEVRGTPDYAAGECFEGPALFVSGAASAYVLPAHRPRILRLFPRAQFVVLPGAGHWVHADRPREFLDAVAEFLERPD